MLIYPNLLKRGNLGNLKSEAGSSRKFSIHMWQNACVNNVRHAMVCDVHFSFSETLTLLNGFCAYT